VATLHEYAAHAKSHGSMDMISALLRGEDPQIPASARITTAMITPDLLIIWD
jgi:hypothetical protein